MGRWAGSRSVLARDVGRAVALGFRTRNRLQARSYTLAQKLVSSRSQSVRPGSLIRVVCSYPETAAPERLMCSA